MPNLLIKICGIQDAELAKQTALAGADYIGIIFHPASKRYVKLNQAQEIASAAKENGAVPVAVFVDQSAHEMQYICQATHITTVQLHGQSSRDAHAFLPHHYHRIYVHSVASSGVIALEQDFGLRHCQASRDFILLDSPHPGTGQSFLWTTLPASLPLPWFLAGGLTADNVAHAITQLHPCGVDVSSGVENAEGNKDLTRIQAFIKAARHAARGPIYEK